MKTITLDGIVWELPYWDLLPPLTDPQFQELKNDIEDKGGNVYPVIWDGPFGDTPSRIRRVIDGGHRLRAIAELRAEGWTGELSEQRLSFATDEEERQAAFDLNAKRRQLTPEAIAEAILKLRQKGMSTRRIAEEVGVSQSAVARELKKATESVDSVELPSVIVGKDGKERQAQRPAPSPAGEHQAPLPLEVSQDPAFIAESVEIAFAKNGPYHPVTLLPSEPSATTAPREAADDDGAQEAVLFDGVSEYRAPQEDELRAEIDRLKSELALASKKKGVLPATADRDDHNTPPEILEVAREFACGRITLDPCWNTNAQTDPILRLTKEEDGLSQNWGRWIMANWGIGVCLRGVVFVNPPYDIEMLDRTNKAGHEQASDWLDVVTLVPVKADQEWYQRAIKQSAAAVCFVFGRVRFWADGQPQQGAAFSSCLFYYGHNAARFCEVFAQLGACVDLDKQRGAA